MRAILSLSLLFAFACGSDASTATDAGPSSGADGGGIRADASGGQPDAAGTLGVSPANLDNGRLTFVENGAPGNQWTFPAGAGTSGTASLVGTGLFPFTYAKTGPSTSRLVFDVQGMDQYDLTWENDFGGTFQESFNGTPGTTGTFAFSR